jgi:signal transduction histidine kinase
LLVSSEISPTTSMRRCAAEVGAEVDIISAPGRGTAVQLRFDKK